MSNDVLDILFRAISLIPGKSSDNFQIRKRLPFFLIIAILIFRSTAENQNKLRNLISIIRSYSQMMNECSECRKSCPRAHHNYRSVLISWQDHSSLFEPNRNLILYMFAFVFTIELTLQPIGTYAFLRSFELGFILSHRHGQMGLSWVLVQC